MEKKKLKRSQIIAAALVEGFNSISESQIDLFIEMFLMLNKNNEAESDYITSLGKYISINDDKISLWDKDSTDELKAIAGDATLFFDNFDYEEFLIRKIKENGSYKEADINEYFNKKEQENLKKLKENGYLDFYFDDNIPYQDDRKFKLSRKGNAKYFKIVYQEEFNNFINELYQLGYNTDLIDDYLMSINYDRIEEISELEGMWHSIILDKERFCEFCNHHDISKYADELYFSNEGKDLKKDEKPFKGRMDKEKKKLVLEFLDKHPNVIAAIGYGSGVISQANSNPNDKKQIDLIIVVDDLKKWMEENIKMNPEEFTRQTIRYFKNASLKKLQKGAPIVYLSSIEYKDELIKMGIISKKEFLSSCYDKTSSYVPFRLEKAIELIKCDDAIEKAIIYDHKTTLITALLMLDKNHLTVRDLIEKICSLSYMGDFRMKIHCEDPNKVKNIVDKQFEYFKEDYDKVNDGYFSYEEEGKISVNYEKIKTDLILLPYDIRRIIDNYRYDIVIGRPYIDSDLQDYYKKVSKEENLKQAIKGISTVDITKAASYALRKIKKGRKK